MNLRKDKKNMVTLLLLVLFAGFTWIGAANGEAQIVLAKAVHICLECIGIG